MVVGNQKIIKVKSYSELYDKYYLQGELGVIEQRMEENIPKERKTKKRTDMVLILALLNQDTDNLYHVVEVGGYYYITIVEVCISKKFDDFGIEYVLLFGEDGVWENFYDEDDVSNSACELGHLEVYNPDEYRVKTLTKL
jgi:hypothetical protein